MTPEQYNRIHNALKIEFRLESNQHPSCITKKELVKGVENGTYIMIHKSFFNKNDYDIKNYKVNFIAFDESNNVKSIQINGQTTEILEDREIDRLINLGLCVHASMANYDHISSEKVLCLKTKEMRDYVYYKDFIQTWKRQLFLKYNE